LSGVQLTGDDLEQLDNSALSHLLLAVYPPPPAYNKHRTVSPPPRRLSTTPAYNNKDRTTALSHLLLAVYPRQQLPSAQLPTSAVNATLLAFAAAAAAIDRYLPLARRSAANPPHVAAAVDYATDRRTMSMMSHHWPVCNTVYSVFHKFYQDVWTESAGLWHVRFLPSLVGGMAQWQNVGL